MKKIYIELNKPSDSKSEKTFQRILNEVQLNRRNVNITWKFNGVATDDILDDIHQNFMKLKNRAFFLYDANSNGL